MKSIESLEALEQSKQSVLEPVDLAEVSVDLSLPVEQRLIRYIEEVKNPYRFRVGKVTVSVGYAQSGDTLRNGLKEHLIRLHLL